jgi:hypothetical protein
VSKAAMKDFPEGSQKEKNSHLMLFSALLLVRKSRMEIKDLERLYSFRGKVGTLLEELAKSES